MASVFIRESISAGGGTLGPESNTPSFGYGASLQPCIHGQVTPLPDLSVLSCMMEAAVSALCSLRDGLRKDSCKAKGSCARVSTRTLHSAIHTACV